MKKIDFEVAGKRYEYNVPESWEELALFPALERIELPQSAAAQAETLPEGVTVVLKGGEGA